MPLTDVSIRNAKPRDKAYKLSDGGGNGLGMNQFAYSRFDAAEENIRRGLDIRKRVLGGRHPDVAESYANLGMVKRAQGDGKSARRYLKRALTISERYGAGSPATRDIRSALDSL